MAKTHNKAIFKIILFSIAFFLCTVNLSFATDYYVRPITGEYGAENGLSYATAYDGFAGITWADVDSGNGKLFVTGTHREQMTVGAAGV